MIACEDRGQSRSSICQKSWAERREIGRESAKIMDVGGIQKRGGNVG